MQRASALQAALAETGHTSAPTDDKLPADRRLSDSNQQWLGKVVDGRYRVLEVIGRGGMGVVYRVEHLRMGKVAAMKVLHRDLANDPEVVARFEREAAAVSRLHHPHTVQVFDFGSIGVPGAGALYLIMEFVRGQDLARIIERDGPMPWSRAAPLLAQICGALQEAHELGIVHRDLKPENVLVTRTANGRDYAKVLDFGLAKLSGDKGGQPTGFAGPASNKTDRTAIVGTPYFMAPEQIRGEEVDHRTDIYSFGALMFELLTAQHLYAGSSAVGVLTKHLTAEPDAPSNRAPKQGIPPQVDYVCRKALARDPSERWQSATELAAAIEEVYAETVHEATGPGSRSSSRVRTQFSLPPEETAEESDLRLRRSDIDAFERGLRRRRVYVFAAVVLVIGAIAAGIWVLVTRQAPPATEEREPNDEVAEATTVAAGAKVTGYLGRRHSKTEGDRDHYIVKFPNGERHVVSVTVTGVPNMDLTLTVADTNGRSIVVDEMRMGDGEVEFRRAITGPVVVTVAQRPLPGQLFPIENVSDPYILTITDEERDGGEVEPNNTEADATPLSLTYEQRGYLDSRGDVDVLRWTGDAGDYNIVVRADGLPLAWRVGEAKVARTPGATKVTLAKGELITLERTDRSGQGPLTAREAMWSIVVTK